VEYKETMMIENIRKRLLFKQQCKNLWKQIFHRASLTRRKIVIHPHPYPLPSREREYIEGLLRSREENIMMYDSSQ